MTESVTGIVPDKPLLFRLRNLQARPQNIPFNEPYNSSLASLKYMKNARDQTPTYCSAVNPLIVLGIVPTNPFPVPIPRTKDLQHVSRLGATTIKPNTAHTK